MQVCWDGCLVDKCDCFAPECLSGVKRFDDWQDCGGVGFVAGNPLFVFFSVQATAFDDADADVNYVTGGDWVAACI